MKRLAVVLLLAFAACESQEPPAPCGPIPQVTVNAGETATATACFDDPNGDALVYSATSSDQGVATASISGATITITAIAPGNASVTVTASDPGGLKGEQSLQVMVPNRAPQPTGTMPPITVPVDQAQTVDASSYFAEPDGETLTYSATSSNTAAATVTVAGGTVTVTAVAKGTANVMVTATDPGGLAATQTFEVTVPNRAPLAGDPIPEMEVFVGDAAEVDVSEHFSDPDGDALVYSASSSNGNVARVSVSGATVRVEAAAQGSATVTVTATDPEGLSAESSFEVTVPNRVPLAGDPIPEMAVFVGDAESFDASEHFSDPDGDELAYSASSSNGNVAEVAVSGATVRVEAAAQGSATVRVTATDPEGLTGESSFEVTVPNRAPVAGDPVPGMEVFVGDAELFDASEHFSDPDGDELTYSASSSNGNVARVSVSGSMVRVEAAAQGSATVTVMATDPEGLTAESSFEVTVPNRAPVAGDPVPEMEVFVGGAESFDASEHFSDPDGDELAYSASSSNGNVAEVAVSGATVRVEAAAQGSATVRVTATDQEGLSAESSFEVTVPNRAPVAGDPVPDTEVFVGDAAEVDASGHFSDPDGDELAYSASSSNRNVARVSVSGATVRVEAAAQGSATVTVTATDQEGLSAESSFEVTVPNRAPVAGDPVPEMEVFVGGVAEVDASGHFSDPDGDELAYAASTSDAGVARVSVSGATVRLEAAAQGSATVTVTATDPEGLTAESSFEVTVPNRAPVAGDPFPEMEVFVGDAAEVDASQHFSDPDGDELAYAASTSDVRVARVSVSGSVVRVEAAAQGSATVRVTATDPEGLTAESSFEVTVPNRAPVAGDPFPDMEVFVGDAAEVDASQHFSDPDGDELAYAASTSDVRVARVSVSGSVVRVEAAAQGSATVRVTATDPEGLSAELSFEVTVPNRAPVAGDPVLDAEVFVGDAAEVDASEHFSDPDGDALDYSASSSNRNVARVSVSGATVRVEAVGQGSATVTVTATDPGGLLVGQSFEVTVPNRGPVVSAPIPDAELHVGDTIEVELSEHFSDPDGDELSYTATSSDGEVATASASGGALIVAGVGQGAASVTVTATDPGGLLVGQSFEVTVPNRKPVVSAPISDADLHVGDTVEVELSEHFSDPDGDELAYAASTSDAGVARVSVSGATVRVEAAAQGSATVRVTATDQEGLTAESSFEVTVPNRGPVVSPPIPDAELHVGDTVEVELSEHFSDPDGDELSYTARSSDDEVATATASGAALSVAGVGRGAASVTVTATDPGGLSVGQSFAVTVPNRRPVVSAAISDAELHVGDTVEVELSEHFSDPDGDELTYSASSSNRSVARASISGSTVTVEAVAAGRATMTVTATDPGGLSVGQSFAVTVPNRRPVVSAAISDAELHVGDTVEVELSEHFSDPDGDELTYSASSSNRSVARASISGSTVTVEAVAAGRATMTVTATDPGDLSATQSFWATVSASELFNLEMAFTSGVSSTVRSHVEDARDEWEAVLEDTELDDVTLNRTLSCLGISRFVGTVDDHLIFVHVDSIDGEGGTLAYAGYCYRRPSDDSPLLSATWIDEADVERMLDLDALVPVMFHELAHALGFSGLHWDRRRLLDDGDDPHFEGELAIEAFDEAGGEDYDGEKVPVQRWVYSHWRESVFGDEIMTPSINLENDELPISAITLQSVADIGYEVDVSRADDYELPDPTVPPPGAPAKDDRAVLDLSNDVVWGPVTVLDADGRVIRVIPPPPGSVRWPLTQGEVRIESRSPPGARSTPPRSGRRSK